MSKNQRKKDLALELYLNTDMTQKEICVQVGWTEGTLKRWKDKENWLQMKQANSVTTHNVITKVIQAMDALQMDNPAKYADSIAKMATALDKLRGNEMLPSNYIQAFKRFNEFLAGWKPEKLKEVNELQNAFIKQLING